MPKGRCVFSPLWLTKDDYKDWLEESQDKESAFCNKCKKAFDVRGMGESAVRKHATGKKHVELVKLSKPALRLTDFVNCPTSAASVSSQFRPRVSSVSSDTSSSSASSGSASGTSGSSGAGSTDLGLGQGPRETMDRYVTTTQVLKAEILWALHSINSYKSFRSNMENQKLFKTMFPDSPTAAMFHCGET